MKHLFYMFMVVISTFFNVAVFAQKTIAHPCLLPLPSAIKWQPETFNLKQCRSVFISDTSLEKEAKIMQSLLLEKGIRSNISTKPVPEHGIIRLLSDAGAPGKEGYELTISSKNITIRAMSSTGIFYGIQTLRQLIDQSMPLKAVTIRDTPAFSWRGYMVDVGRNFQSMQKLKEQIDIMARYKLNVFHFHATENIAWRFESKKFPQLNMAENMIRNKGKYYSETDIKELIRYCNDRHILFVPEIDMPGHSVAFTRTFKTDMQSKEGTVIIKKLLEEFIDTYPLTYFHIGGDEVKITDKAFLPEITDFIENEGIKTVAWSPGGNIKDQTIRQLWMDDKEHKEESEHRFIDSRRLYLNHMDPLETVTTIFYCRIGDQLTGDDRMLGATLCLWPDRRVANEDVIFHMNGVYPGLLAFVERSWRGGGEPHREANIGIPGTPSVRAFARFEDRLLKHQQLYFSQLPFPYTRQQNSVWHLYGPFNNNGDLQKKFTPETSGKITAKPFAQIVGGTIILRHWWAPLIHGAVPDPKENSTVYATRKIWSDKAGYKNFWIVFNDLSRSPATDSPPVGAWDDKHSQVWLNGNPVPSPQWQRGGQKGDPETPLVDEGYSYRTPSKLYLKKGWNTVLIKAPVGSFKSKDWQNPVKWMFTFIEAPEG